MGWRDACFCLASSVGIACSVCCGAKQASPVVHTGNPVPDAGPAAALVADPGLPSPNPLADPGGSAPTPVKDPHGEAPAPPSSAGEAWCPCPPVPGATPAPPSSPAHWCPCPQLAKVVPEPPPVPLSKNVPDRACSKDGQCGDGLCDRGRCAPLWTEDAEYGQNCKVSSTGHLCASGYLCLEGRCRSCVSDAECVKEMPGSACGFYRSPESRRRLCGREVLSIAPSIPALPAPKQNVANRACSKDGECGDGFCDRGRCAPRPNR
jgi:hypothetical protein